MKNLFSIIKHDCRHFRGDLPCKPHKEFGVHCFDERRKICQYYEKIEKIILIIKLGAIGDVIRTTPLLRKLKQVHPTSQIWWITYTPEILPAIVDVALPFNTGGISILEAMHFDIAFNLDKDKEACALLSLISSDVKKGYILRRGVCVPIDKAAEHKYLTGIFDDISKKNNKSYQTEIFEICGFKFHGEEYLMPQ